MFFNTAKVPLLLPLIPAVLTAQAEASPWPYHIFASEPTILTPVIEVNVTGDTAPGHIMFAQFGAQAVQKAAIIMSQDGELLWQSTTMFDKPPSNLTPSKFQGKDILLFWEPDDLLVSDLPNNSHGQIRIIDDSYQTLYNVTLSDPALWTYGQFDSLIDPHEAYMTSSGTILVLAYDALPWDLSSVGGSVDGWIRDGVVYEIDVVTNEILFSWRASDHFSISESYAPLTAEHGFEGDGLTAASAWDYLHLNSATAFEDGIVVSARHAFCVTYIERRTGETRWTLQGNGNGDVGMTAAATFQWQHDVHVQRPPDGTMLVSLFNNYNNMTEPFNETTGLLLQLSDDETTVKTVTGVTQYKDANEELVSGAGGSVQLLDNGNVFLGYGTQPVMKEYERDGSLVLSFRFGSRDSSHVVPGSGSYRARKSEWKGYPVTQPKVAACRYENGTMDVWMSWNGATEVHSWNIYAGRGGENHDLVADNVPRDGFETKVTVKGSTSVQIEALGGCRSQTDTRFSEIVLTKLCTGREAGTMSAAPSHEKTQRDK